MVRVLFFPGRREFTGNVSKHVLRDYDSPVGYGIFLVLRCGIRARSTEKGGMSPAPGSSPSSEDGIIKIGPSSSPCPIDRYVVEGVNHSGSNLEHAKRV